MNGKFWNDINLPWLSSGKDNVQEKKTAVTGVEGDDVSDDKPEKETEVRIKDAKWVPGPDGYVYNQTCYLDVSTEYLPLKNNRKTVRKRIYGKLFGIYDGVEVDLGDSVEGFIDDKTNIARLTIKKLWYVNDPHYDAWQKDKSTSVQYVIRDISHTMGANKIDSPKLELPQEAVYPDRWIIFEETAENIEPDFTYELSKAQLSKNKWIYAFATTDGKTFSKAWEIRTDGTGKKYATVEINENSFGKRPDQEQYEDVAFLPALIDNKKTQLYACVSDVRLSKDRIFNKENGLFSNPVKRCSNIDDKKQAVKKELSGGEEKIVILNSLLHAEALRKRFDDVYTKWEEARHASFLAKDEKTKKEKLAAEFGAILLRIFESAPDYKKHLSPGQYPVLYDAVDSCDKAKVKITQELTFRLEELCRFLKHPVFTQTCTDYTSLIRPGEEQGKAFTTFENRTGNLFEHLSRFPQGIDIIGNLLKDAKSIDEHTWLQDTLLLKNDVWSFSDSKPKVGAVKTFQNMRKLFDGAAKLAIEGTRAGVKAYKPEAMANVIAKVLETTGESFDVTLQHAIMNEHGVRSFSKVFNSFDENSFWRFEIKPQTPYNNFVAKGLLSDSFKNLLRGLEGVALIYSLKDQVEKNANGKGNAVDNIALGVRTLAYFVKNEMIKFPYEGKMVKIAAGPIAGVNLLLAAYDCYNSYKSAYIYEKNSDYDAAAWNNISGVGNVIAVVGYSSLLATYLAGAAAASMTGIGLIPGTLLAVMGTSIAIGSSVMAAQAKNTPIENLILKTPWGTNPEKHLNEITYTELNIQYLKMMRIVNTFKVDINNKNETACIHLNRIEPDTLIRIHEVVYGNSFLTDGSSMETVVVGSDIILNDSNCHVSRDDRTGKTEIIVNLKSLCPFSTIFLSKFRNGLQNKIEPKPEYIKVTISIELDDQKNIVLPDINKRMIVEKYYGQDEVTKII